MLPDIGIQRIDVIQRIQSARGKEKCCRSVIGKNVTFCHVRDSDYNLFFKNWILGFLYSKNPDAKILPTCFKMNTLAEVFYILQKYKSPLLALKQRRRYIKLLQFAKTFNKKWKPQKKQTWPKFLFFKHKT